MAFDVDDKKVKTVLSNSSLAKSKVELPKKIESEENEYTKINIIFPKGNFSKV